jgi:hypothetical protein
MLKKAIIARRLSPKTVSPLAAPQIRRSRSRHNVIVSASPFGSKPAVRLARYVVFGDALGLDWASSVHKNRSNAQHLEQPDPLFSMTS